HDAAREQTPAADVQRETEDHNAEAQHQMIEPENDKARGGTDDQVQLYAGVAAEKRDEPEQGGAFGTGDDQPAKDLTYAVHQGYAESHRDQAEIDRDDPAHRSSRRTARRRPTK